MYYLREGYWCVCECSCNWSNGVMNDGVSVHECREVDPGKWKPLGRSWERRGGADFPSSDMPWYLVSGTPTGLTGGDSEPLIKMVKAHFELTCDIRQQVFVVAQSPRYVPVIIHEQINGTCQFPAGEFEAMQEIMYCAERDYDE